MVAFVDARSSAVLADAAATAARALGATLTGFYVRDVTLQDLANLPFAATLGIAGDPPEPLTPDAVERAFARVESQCRAALALAMRDAPQTWSFETVSGRLEILLPPRAARSSLIAIAGDRSADPTLWTLARTIGATAGAVLVVPSCAPQRRRGPVLAIDDGSATGAEATALANQVAQATARPLAVLTLGKPATTAQPRAGRRQAESIEVEVHGWPEWDAATIGEPILRIAPSMIVGDLMASPFADPEAAARLFARVAVPLLLLSFPIPTEG
jgi:hypothetical protein